MVAALVLAGAARPAPPIIPMFNVGENEHLLYESGLLYFDAFNLDATGAVERLTITTPRAYGVELSDPPGTNLGTAYISTVTTPRGATTAYNGSLAVLDQGAYAADPAAQACAPGEHTALWQASVKSDAGASIQVPIAIDQIDTGYRLTMCFDAEHATGLDISEVDIEADNVFRNPATAGKYLFDAIATPFAADGTPSTGTAFELQGFEYMPQTLTAKTTYNTKTKVFTVSGVSKLDGNPRVGVNVHVWAGKSAVTSSMREIGTTVTGAGGVYHLTKKLSWAPKWMYGHIDHYYHSICDGSAAPAGCVSSTTDGRSTYVTHVVAVHR